MSRWRTAGRVKHARKRALKKVEIKMGRVLSMQQYLKNTAHQHDHEEEPVVEMQTGTHELVNKETGQVLEVGTESQMRKQRTLYMQAQPDTAFSVRKIK